MATAAFTSSATTGAAASPGRSPIVFPSGWHRSPCCHRRIPTPSIGRCKCPMAIKRTDRGITRPFSNLVRPICCWPITRNGSASGWPRPAFPQVRSRRIFPCSATRTRWKRRWPGIARAARSAHRSARSGCPPCTSGAMPTTPSGGWPPRVRVISSRHLTASRFSPASAISPPTRRRTASTNCYCSTSRPIRSDRSAAELGHPENVVLQQLEQGNMAGENHGDPCVAPECKSSKDLRSTTPTPQQGGPPLNDGPDCYAATIADYSSRALASLRLVDIPEDRRRRTVEHAADRFSPRARDEILPERDVDHLVKGLLLDVGGDLLLLLR